MKKNLKRKLGVLLIVGGIIFLSYPLIGQWITQYKQNQMMREWENETIEFDKSINANARNEEEIDFIQAYKDLNRAFQDENEEQESKERKSAYSPKVIGTITIKKINMTLPLIMDATQINLKYGAAQLKGTTPVGQVGNTAVAGHRSYTHGKFFNHLNELKNGDEIVIETKNQIYKYKVYAQKIVKPTDLSVLKGNGKDKILTLITCERTNIGTQRLIIHAKLVE